MNKTNVRSIITEAGYDRALREIEPYFEMEPEPGSLAAERFSTLTRLIEAWERKHWAIDPPKVDCPGGA